MSLSIAPGIDEYPYLQHANDAMGRAIPVVDIDADCADRATMFERRLNPGEAEPLAAALQYDERLVTDDCPARPVAAVYDIPVTGSIGILIRGVEQECIETSTADTWLNEWIDEAEHRAPARDLSASLEE
jgi:predicted nucleic acid-binding protein